MSSPRGKDQITETSEYTEEIEEVHPASLRPSIPNFGTLDQRTASASVSAVRG